MSEKVESEIKKEENVACGEAIEDGKILKDLVNKKKEPKPKGTGDNKGKKKGKNADDNEADGEFKLKTAKGTRDFDAPQMKIREQVFEKIINVFKLHGAVTIDTPVFERKEILTQKYGEDSKLIYDLADQQGELLSLRYDLTVPFSRYVAMNKIKNIKRYQIGKVYRRDQPCTARGRFREFYQCDFDIAGIYDRMIPDSECIKIIADIIQALDVGKFEIKINHRSLLDGMFEICGVPVDKFRTTSSSIDKLDKSPWLEIRNELINEKGLSESVVDKIGEYTQHKGKIEMIKMLKEKEELMNNKLAKEGLDDLELLFNYCEIFQITDKIQFDFSLARGLDYYTGVIFEAVLLEMPVLELNDEDEAPSAGTGVGSVAAGGRYDNLVNMFDKRSNVPCVGLSIGVERLFAVMQKKIKLSNQKVKTVDTEVYVVTAQKGLVSERLKLCTELWNGKIRTECSYKANPKALDQFQYCEDNLIPFCVIIGEDEIKNNVVTLKNCITRSQEKLERLNLVEELRKRLSEL